MQTILSSDVRPRTPVRALQRCLTSQAPTYLVDDHRALLRCAPIPRCQGPEDRCGVRVQRRRTVLGQIVQLLAIPLQLHYLGPAQFGLIVLFNSLVAAGSLDGRRHRPHGAALRRSHRPAPESPRARDRVKPHGNPDHLRRDRRGGLAGTQAWISWHGATPVAAPYTRRARGLVAAAVSASMVSWLGLNMLRGLRQYRVFALCESIHRVVLPLLCGRGGGDHPGRCLVLLALCVWTTVAAAVTLRYAGRRAQVRLHLTRNLRYFRRRMFSFGRWVWAQSVFAYAGSQADRLVVAGAMGLSALGIYAVAVSAANAFLAVFHCRWGVPAARSGEPARPIARGLTQAFVRYTLLFSAVSA